jgi:hypothetical protein
VNFVHGAAPPGYVWALRVTPSGARIPRLLLVTQGMHLRWRWDFGMWELVP